jgi:hypothetical protein
MLRIARALALLFVVLPLTAPTPTIDHRTAAQHEIRRPTANLARRLLCRVRHDREPIRADSPLRVIDETGR